MKFWKKILNVSLIALVAACGGSPVEDSAAEAENERLHVYFGTYTRETSRGIYHARFDPETGALSEPGLAAEIESPSYLALHPNKRFLYAVTEAAEGTVSGFSIGAEGELTKINTRPTHGAKPCDLEVDGSGRMLVAANYGSGSTIAYSIGEDGALSEPTGFQQHEGSSVHERQKSPHAHSVDFSFDNRHVIVSDLGIDKVITFAADPESGEITPLSEVSTAPGSGPRHFAFHASGKFGYSLGELASTITVMSHADGEFETIEALSTLPEDFEGHSTTAEIAVHRSGRFVYASNRGHDSIAVFSIDATGGHLTRTAVIKSGGVRPRNFGIDPSGHYLLAANHDTGNVVVFKIDQQTGTLHPTGDEIEVDAAVCVQFVKLGM